ncbi:MAG: penicillin-binding protein [Deltaproteobacteria bacterium HGW-Deltaproteobacteria-1]|nr:MAG: penicillin-binding protein [Deltaproteobacteria bacterium HGW-Deltaproteobacteria-1]
MICAFGLLLSLAFASSAFAVENIAAYPYLPKGYKSIRVFDSHGRFVGRVLADKRYWVEIDQIPIFLQKALIAVEDVRFYEHGGIDMRGIARALVKDVMKGRMAEGGSTITQQLIKNKYFKGEKTIERKVREGILAMEYEQKYTKKQILEMYFNEVYFGNGAWGIAQAARLYFDKTPQELNEMECILLAATPKAPTHYNPLGDPAMIDRRKKLILSQMVNLKMITARKAKELRLRRVFFTKQGEAPYYVAHVRIKLIEQYGPEIIEQGGLDVITAMDLRMQRLAEKTLKEGVGRINPQLQGALVALNPNTGDILAAVGGIDFVQNPYDRAFFAKRQPGSAIKPLIYAAALEKGFTAGTILNDDPVSYERGNSRKWTPKNFQRKYYGDLSLRQALAYSNNVISVKLLEAIGVPFFIDFASRLGLTLSTANDLTLALGSGEVTLHDLVSAYVPFANGGLRPRSRTIIRVYDRNRRTWTETPLSMSAVLSPASAFVTTQMMEDVLTYGTAKTLKSFVAKRPAAGKTGTTDDYRDAWFIGYTPQIITGVWVGYDRPRPGGAGFTGGSVCAPVWGRFMRGALAGKPVIDFSKPDTVVGVMIDPETNELATPLCPVQREEFYIAGTQPTKPCWKHGVPDREPAPVPEPPPPPMQQMEIR